jgi:hypothetical protein
MRVKRIGVALAALTMIGLATACSPGKPTVEVFASGCKPTPTGASWSFDAHNVGDKDTGTWSLIVDNKTVDSATIPAKGEHTFTVRVPKGEKYKFTLYDADGKPAIDSSLSGACSAG